MTRNEIREVLARQGKPTSDAAVCEYLIETLEVVTTARNDALTQLSRCADQIIQQGCRLDECSKVAIGYKESFDRASAGLQKFIELTDNYRGASADAVLAQFEELAEECAVERAAG